MSEPQELLGPFEVFIKDNITEDVHKLIKTYARYKHNFERAKRQVDELMVEVKDIEKNRAELAQHEDAEELLTPLGSLNMLTKLSKEDATRLMDEQLSNATHLLNSKQADVAILGGELDKLNTQICKKLTGA